MPKVPATAAGSSCAADSPAVTWPGVAPRARASAVGRRESIDVAHAMRTALTAASVSSATVSASTTWFTCSVTGLGTPGTNMIPVVRASFRAMSPCMAIAATTIAAVIARLIRASTARRGWRTARRTPSRSGTGRRADSAIRRGERRGVRAGPLSARTVLVRAPRIAGTRVAAPVTARATTTTIAAEPGVRSGRPAARSPALGRAIAGAAAQPATSPTAAAATATSRCSASRTNATSRGVAPAAFNSPTRRVWSARRPPTRTATHATASRASAQVPVSRAWFTRWSSAVAYAPMSCQERTFRCAAAKAGAAAGSARRIGITWEVTFLPSDLRSARVVQTRPGVEEG
ncbi:hypothetical protein GCM10029978_031760 [Actinoallomurus acanthiterrae]